MIVTINLDTVNIKKLETYRKNKITKFESLIPQSRNDEEVKLLHGFIEDYKRESVENLLLRYLM